MNIIDIIILLIVAVFLIRGTSRGVVKEVGTILGMSLAFTAATKYIDMLTAYIQSSSGVSGTIATVLAYVVLFIGTFIVLSIILGAITKIIRKTALGPVDRIGGAAIGVFLGALLSSIILVAISLLPFSKDWISGPKGSVLYPYVVDVAPRAYGLLSGMNPSTDSFYEKLHMLDKYTAPRTPAEGSGAETQPSGGFMDIIQKLDPREAKKLMDAYQKLESGQGDQKTTYDEALKMLNIDTTKVPRQTMDELLKQMK